MANQKISQMPVAAQLTGTELIELVQSSVNVQSTTSALAGLVANPFGLSGNPNGGALTASLAYQMVWTASFPSTAGGFQGASNSGSNGAWLISNGTATFQSMNGGGANLGASVQMTIMTSSAGANSAVDLANTTFNVGASSTIALIRLATSGLLISGFTMTMYFAFTTNIAVEQIFLGFCPGLNGLGNTLTPSTLLNMIGLAKDSADANLQFMINNGAGTATKTSLGVTHTSLAGHLLRLVVTCDASGNCAITLNDLESGGLTYSVTYPTATAKLPAVVSGQGGQLEPHVHLNNGGQASAVAIGIQSTFVTGGFGSI